MNADEFRDNFLGFFLHVPVGENEAFPQQCHRGRLGIACTCLIEETTAGMEMMEAIKE